jgi:hypothetical protein
MTVTEARVGLTLPAARPLTAAEVAGNFDLIDRLLALLELAGPDAGPVPEAELRRRAVDQLSQALSREVDDRRAAVLDLQTRIVTAASSAQSTVLDEALAAVDTEA